MRKYLVATAIGAMLLAGQAAASDSAVVSAGDRLGGDSAAANQLVGTGGIFIGLSAALLIGLVAWGFSEGHGQTISASP